MPTKFSFKKGWNQLPQTKTHEVQKKIMAVLGLRTRTSFYPRLNGAIEPKYGEALAIEDIFHEYGITDIWGE